LRRLIFATAPRWRLRVEFLAHSGLRVSEALALTWADVDLGKRRIRVRRRLYRGSFGPPKTRFARRDVPLTGGMAQALWNARGEAGDPRDEALVFSGRDGRPLDRGQVFRAVKAAAKRAGVPWAGLHTLRHTAASLLFSRGWNAVQVQRFLGHHSAAFTLATYVHLLEDGLPEPASFDSLIGEEQRLWGGAGHELADVTAGTLRRGAAKASTSGRGGARGAMHAR
jgi:integrase